MHRAPAPHLCWSSQAQARTQVRRRPASIETTSRAAALDRTKYPPTGPRKLKVLASPAQDTGRRVSSARRYWISQLQFRQPKTRGDLPLIGTAAPGSELGLVVRLSGQCIPLGAARIALLRGRVRRLPRSNRHGGAPGERQDDEERRKPSLPVHQFPPSARSGEPISHKQQAGKMGNPLPMVVRALTNIRDQTGAEREALLFSTFPKDAPPGCRSACHESSGSRSASTRGGRCRRGSYKGSYVQPKEVGSSRRRKPLADQSCASPRSRFLYIWC